RSNCPEGDCTAPPQLVGGGESGPPLLMESLASGTTCLPNCDAHVGSSASSSRAELTGHQLGISDLAGPYADSPRNVRGSRIRKRHHGLASFALVSSRV